jgi:hypothetical protein
MNGAVEEALRRLEDAQREVKRLGELEDWTPEVIDQITDAVKAETAAREFYQQELAEYEANKEENPLLKWLSYDSDAALDRIASQQWLIYQVLPVDAFGVVYGPSGSYKSFVGMDLSACVASGMNWHGNDTDNPGHVIYVGAEGATGLHLRKKAWEIRHGKKLTNLAILGTAVTLNNATDRHFFVELCLDAAKSLNAPIKLIVVDTLARSFQGEENSATDMGEFVKACDTIRAATGATVLVVHHSGKDADKGARGSSALRAACDFEFKVVSPAKKVTKLSCTKAKDSDPFDDITFKLNVVEIGRKDSKGVEMGSLTLTMSNSPGDMRPDLTGHKQTINSLVASEMARTGEDWVFKSMVQDAFFAVMGVDKKHGATKTAWSRGINDLVVDGWLEIDGNGRITRPNPY